MALLKILAQTLILIAIPLVVQGSVKPGKTEDDMEDTVENKALGGILSVGRYIIVICISVGFTCARYSVLTIEHPKGAEYTPPISVTMHCVINLTFQLRTAEITVNYAHMLVVLSVRMRVTWLMHCKGNPHVWMQA